MNPTLKIIFGLLGGLAIFIYGMNIMSESLQKLKLFPDRLTMLTPALKWL